MPAYLRLVVMFLQGTPIASLANELERAFADGRLTLAEDLSLGEQAILVAENYFPGQRPEFDLAVAIVRAVEVYVVGAAERDAAAVEAKKLADVANPHTTTFPAGTPGKNGEILIPQSRAAFETGPAVAGSGPENAPFMRGELVQPEVDKLPDGTLVERHPSPDGQGDVTVGGGRALVDQAGREVLRGRRD